MISQATHPRSRLFAPPALPAPTPPSASAPLIAVDANPLQHPGCDVRLRRCTYGGPICAVDVRMYFDRRTGTQGLVSHASRLGKRFTEATTSRRSNERPARPTAVRSRVAGTYNPHRSWRSAGFITWRPVTAKKTPLNATHCR